MERLRPDEPVVQLRLEPVEQLPLQGRIPARVTLSEPPALLEVEDVEVGGTVAVLERGPGVCQTVVLGTGSCLIGGTLDGYPPGSRIPMGAGSVSSVPISFLCRGNPRLGGLSGRRKRTKQSRNQLAILPKRLPDILRPGTARVES